MSKLYDFKIEIYCSLFFSVLFPEKTFEEMEKYRNWFQEQDNICSDESLRRNKNSEIDKMRGSFRRLEVD